MSREVTYTVAHPSAIPESFMEVALVTLELEDDEHPRENLEFVFEYTNNFDEHPWHENEAVKLLTDPAKARSTSVGDRIHCRIDGLLYLWEVDRAGFKQLREAGVWVKEVEEG